MLSANSNAVESISVDKPPVGENGVMSSDVRNNTAQFSPIFGSPEPNTGFAYIKCCGL